MDGNTIARTKQPLNFEHTFGWELQVAWEDKNWDRLFGVGTEDIPVEYLGNSNTGWGVFSSGLF